MPASQHSNRDYLQPAVIVLLIATALVAWTVLAQSQPTGGVATIEGSVDFWHDGTVLRVPGELPWILRTGRPERWVRRFKVLQLSGTRTDDRTLEHLGPLTPSRSVDLARTRVTDTGIAHLFDCDTESEKCQATFCCLDLWKTAVTWELFAGADLQATALLLNETAVTSEFDFVGSVAFVGLARTAVADHTCPVLSGCSGVDLERTAVGDAGVRSLTKCVWLDLSGTRITDDALDTLSRSRRLMCLRVYGTDVTSAGVNRFRQAKPACRLEWDGGEHPGAEARRAVINVVDHLMAGTLLGDAVDNVPAVLEGSTKVNRSPGVFAHVLWSERRKTACLEVTVAKNRIINVQLSRHPDLRLQHRVHPSSQRQRRTVAGDNDEHDGCQNNRNDHRDPCCSCSGENATHDRADEAGRCSERDRDVTDCTTT